MRYTMVSGLGNTFGVFDATDALDLTEAQWAELARAFCDPATGVGADGILLLGPGESHDDSITVATMRIINADGSTSEMCGNGLRAVARLLVEQGRARVGGSLGFVIDTDAGQRICRVDKADPSQVTTQLGVASFGPEAVGADASQLTPEGGGVFRFGAESAWFASVGNPHAVVRVDAPLTDADLASRGEAIERAPAFPARINAQFARILSPRAVAVQSWERGAGATRACGTGAAAVVSALHDAGLVEAGVVVSLPGGDLAIEIDPLGMITQRGPARIVRTGDWPLG
ncbi:MAG: diaminopimelate epimerase [Phycisphaeraceae bacterium]|nr:diaminopimelate epimerase [Phycisphaeraceae bacterium]